MPIEITTTGFKFKFPPSTETLWRVIRRTRSVSGQGNYVMVEDALRGRPTLGDAVGYYEFTYLHDDIHGTEVIFMSNRGEFHVVRVEVPEPRKSLIPVGVKA